jgi:hypothetical protein
MTARPKPNVEDATRVIEGMRQARRGRPIDTEKRHRALAAMAQRKRARAANERVQADE